MLDGVRLTSHQFGDAQSSSQTIESSSDDHVIGHIRRLRLNADEPLEIALQGFLLSLLAIPQVIYRVSGLLKSLEVFDGLDF